MAGKHYGIVVALLLSCLITLTFNVLKAEEGGTIYIRVDGSVYPPGAPIVCFDNATYVFISDASDSIVVEKNNVLIDGAGYTLQGGGKWAGVNLTGRSNITVMNLEITDFYYGIYLYGSTHINLFNNSVSSNKWDGIYLLNSIDNFIFANNISSNRRYGIMLSESSNNRIFHNNFINNTKQAYTYDSFNNFWDDGYPSGGNYWSDYNGTDLFSGPYQNGSSDGVGDSPYVIDVDNRDNYPLIGPYSTFKAEHWDGVTYNFNVVTNSTILNFELFESLIPEIPSTISLNLSGPDNTTGFCRLTIPNIIVQDLWQDNYTVLLNGEPCPFRNWTDTQNTYIYINYTHSTHEITIIPEFPSTLTLAFFATTFLTATSLWKSKRKHQSP